MQYCINDSIYYPECLDTPSIPDIETDIDMYESIPGSDD